jgi:prepilin-type N-terminal cleavage/methylation domain-containing protein
VSLRPSGRIFKSVAGLAEESRMARALLGSEGGRAEREEKQGVRRETRAQAGVTMIELVVVIAIMGVLAAMAAPNVREWREHQRIKASARGVADAFSVARGEALRTGDRHIVFFGEDIDGNPLVNVLGNPLIVVVHDDDNDCDIDTDEARRDFPLETDVQLGVANASVPHSLDTGNTSSLSGGNTFVQPGGSEALWVLFGADGIPVALSDACAVGITGSGGGALYLENGRRDYAIVLTPLGGVRVSAWEVGVGEWQ